MKVEDAEGRVWRVSRRWVPWRRRGELSDSADGLGLLKVEPDDPIGCLVWTVGLVLAVPTVTLMIVGLTFALVELLLILVILPFAILGRVLLGRHWHVEVRHGFEHIWEVDAGNWAASRSAITTNTELLRRGLHPAQRMVPPPPDPSSRPAGPGGKHARRP